MTEKAPLLAEVASPEEWRRLDRRMLLVHPVTEVTRFLPGLLAIFLLGRTSGPQDGSGWWHYGALAAVVALGLLRYLTTTYRITPEQVQLRKGLVSKHVLSTRLDRVRTIDLTASPIHRVLGLSKVVIGTGSSSTSSDEKISLDSLGTAAARDLRAELLHREAATGVVNDIPEADQHAPLEPALPDADRVLVRLDPTWVRYAPLTTSGVVTALAAFGFLANLVNQIARDSWDTIVRRATSTSLAWPLLVVILAVVLLLGVTVLAVLGYLLTNWGFTVSHNTMGRSYHLRRGLLTTRETSIDEDRIRGLEIGEPLGLRLAGGGRLAVIVTGLDKKDRSSSTLVPPAPAGVVRSVGEDVLGEPGPLTTPLIPHGAAAERRRWIRALVPAVTGGATLVALVLAAHWPTWLLAVAAGLVAGSVPLARDRYAGLGHALTQSYLVVRSGSLSRRRDALERDGVIGWNLRSSFFQRRAGLVSLTATTAAGRGAYTAYDVVEGVAVGFADEATPGLLEQFRG